MTTNLGLTTLNNKISAIENKLNITKNITFADNVVSNIASVKEENIKSYLSSVESMFMSGLIKSNINISSTEEIILNLTKLIEYTVKFVEANGAVIAKNIFTDLTSGFKLSTAVNFVMSIVQDIFPNNVIVTYIEHFVQLLFPHPSTQDISALERAPSIKKAKRFVLRKSGCLNKKET